MTFIEVYEETRTEYVENGTPGPAGIPGDPGPPGANGLGVNRGPWSALTTYIQDDIVTHNGSTWITLTANTNDEPPSANWQLLAAKGEPGQDGADGLPGQDGIDGADGQPGIDGQDGNDGADGDPGPPGVVAATPPVTYNSGTQTVGITVGTVPNTVASGDHIHAAEDITVDNSGFEILTGDEVQAVLQETEDLLATIFTDLDDKQTTDTDLDDIAALNSATPGVIASIGGGWIHRTYAQLKTLLGLTKADVGLGNVDNTSDDNKPISTATATALSAKADLVGGLVISAQLPSYVDDVIDAANFVALPAVGEASKIYITIDNGLTFRWSGSTYAEISASLALGETSATAYRGDRGKTAYDHSQITAGNPHGVTKADVGLGNATNTSDANKPVSTAQQAALDTKAPVGAQYVTLAADATLTAEAVLGTAVNMRGTLALRPAAGIPGRTYATENDIQAFYRDNGLGWDQLTQGLLESALVKAYKSGVLTANRHGMNFIPGTGMTINTADNPGLDATDIIISGPASTTMIRKAFNETVTNSLILQPDDYLLAPLAANDIKSFRILVFYDGSTTGDINFGFTAPAGASGTFGIVGLQTAATTSTDSARFISQDLITGNVGAGCAGVGTKLNAIISGIVVNGATPGNLQLTWAQRVLDAINSTRVLADSHMII